MHPTSPIYHIAAKIFRTVYDDAVYILRVQRTQPHRYHAGAAPVPNLHIHLTGPIHHTAAKISCTVRFLTMMQVYILRLQRTQPHRNYTGTTPTYTTHQFNHRIVAK